MTPRTRWAAPVTCLLIGWALLMINVGGAWVGHQDANGAWIGTAVRNYARYGLQTGGVPILNTEPARSPANFRYYTAHPPLTVWMTALPTLIIGQDEIVFRFAFASFTLIGAAVLYTLTRRLYSDTAAVWSTGFYLLTPMIAYFGRIPDHESPAILWLLLFALVLLGYLRQPTRWRWLTLTILLILQSWTAWGGLIAAYVVTALAIFVARPRQRLALIAVCFIAAAAAALVLVYFQSQWSGAIDDLVARFLWRTSNQSLSMGSQTFTFWQYLGVIFVRSVTLFMPTILLIAVFGGIALLRSGRTVSPAGRFGRWLPFALIAGGLAFMLVFRNASYVHDYYLIYVTPGVATLAGFGLCHFWSRRRSVRWMRPLLFALLVSTPIMVSEFLADLYVGSDSRDPLLIAEVLTQQTGDHDWIASNLPDLGFGIEYYSERDVQWYITSINLRPPDGGNAFYLGCGDDGQISAPVVQSLEVIPGCALSQLR